MGLACEQLALEPYTFPELVRAYLQHLRGKPCYGRTLRLAKPWILTLQACPTRKEIKDRHARIGSDGVPQTGDHQRLAAVANKELALLRSILHFGIDAERWTGGNPTERIRKWKTARRKRVFKFLDLRTLLLALEKARKPRELRDRALFGLMLLTGCRPGEARHAKKADIRPYGAMGIWHKPHTKTGEPQEVPLPSQLMAWLATLPSTESEYLFAGKDRKPIQDRRVNRLWSIMRKRLGLELLWTYDFRRSLASHMPGVLHVPDSAVKAILNHSDGSSQEHYTHYTFDTLCPIMQQYADWLFSLKTRQPDVSGLSVTAPLRSPISGPTDRERRDALWA